MKLLTLFILLPLWSSGQDYLETFSNISKVEFPMVIERFDSIATFKISARSEPFIIEKDAPVKTPSKFSAFMNFAMEGSFAWNTIEIAYKICDEGDCFTRYNLKVGSTYKTGLVFRDPLNKGVNKVDIKSIAEMLTLLEFLALIDKENLPKKGPITESLIECYRPDMYGFPDISCLTSKLKAIPPSARQAYLNELKK